VTSFNALSHETAPSAGVPCERLPVGSDPSSPFVLITVPVPLCCRLIPVLVNGMKYSEIDIILLTVSSYRLICVHVGRRMYWPETFDTVFCLTNSVEATLRVFKFSSRTSVPRGTPRKTRTSRTTSRTSGRASTAPARSPSSTRATASRTTTTMSWMTMTIPSLIGTCVSSVPVF